MEQIVYGDVLFVINLGMDYLSLYLAGSLLRLRKRQARLLVAASIGAVYAVVSLFAVGNSVVALLIHAAVTLLMFYTAYGRAKLFCGAAVFYAVGFMLGGAVTALYEMLGDKRHIVSRGDVGRIAPEVNVGTIALLAAVAAALTLVVGRFRAKTPRNVDVTVTLCGKSLTLEGLVDSGNLLTEPLSGRAVVIVGESDMRRLLDDGCDVSRPETLPEVYARRLRLIPATSVTGSRLLSGFVCDALTVGGIERECVVAVGETNEGRVIVPESLV